VTSTLGAHCERGILGEYHLRVKLPNGHLNFCTGQAATQNYRLTTGVEVLYSGQYITGWLSVKLLRSEEEMANDTQSSFTIALQYCVFFPCLCSLCSHFLAMVPCLLAAMVTLPSTDRFQFSFFF
jgi:hypothetical protein